jgi:hypothetical protein
MARLWKLTEMPLTLPACSGIIQLLALLGGMMRIITVLLATLVCCSRVAPVTGQPSGTNDLVLSLDAIEPVIAAGSVPRVRLTLTNVSDHVCRVLDVERRGDLRDTYCNLVVLKDGKPVDVPRAISDPGPVSDTDWLAILPKGTKTIVLTRFPDQFEALPPGVYEAYVDFWRDPYQSHDTAYKSPWARFTVTK